jgi:hypothetical protein
MNFNNIPYIIKTFQSKLVSDITYFHFGYKVSNLLLTKVSAVHLVIDDCRCRCTSTKYPGPILLF